MMEIKCPFCDKALWENYHYEETHKKLYSWLSHIHCMHGENPTSSIWTCVCGKTFGENNKGCKGIYDHLMKLSVRGWTIHKVMAASRKAFA